MDVLRPVRSFGIGLATMLLAVVATAVLAVLAPVGVPASAEGVASIEAEPAQGEAGSITMVTGRNIPPCNGDLLLRWDGVPVDDAKLVGEGFSKEFKVPQSKPGPHEISAICKVVALKGNNSPGNDSGGIPTFTFTVVAAEPAARPQLVLGAAEGRPGDPLDLTGTDYRCGRDLLIGWDSADPAPLAVSSRSETGEFRARTTVPAELPAGQHRVGVYCADRRELGDAKPFAVLVAGSPQLVVDPERGAAGQRTRATGSGFDACAGGDAVLWFDTRGSGGSATVSVAASGGFAADLVVPGGLPAGAHTLHAACAKRAEVAAAAGFTVLAGAAPGSRSPGSSGSSASPADPLLSIAGSGTSGGAGLTGPQWGVLLGGALALAAAGTYGLSHRRGPGWVGKHVTAQGRPSGPGSYQVADDAVADPGGRSHSVRLEPRPDPGTQHIEETER